MKFVIYFMLFFWLILKGDTHIGGSSREGSFKETITLKWCTPRTNNIGRYFKEIEREKNQSEVLKVCISFWIFVFHCVRASMNIFFSFTYGNISLYSFKSVFSSISELHYCTGAYRISPVDVNSRPSSCLTNFLLNGNFQHLVVSSENITSAIISKKCENLNSRKLSLI